ncbi:MAG: alpha/beta hydrolase-fold protein [Solirubrobacteraceae bacterium]
MTWPGLGCGRTLLVGLGTAALASVIVLVATNADAQLAAPPTGRIAPALEARIDRETGGRLTTVHFRSDALHKKADYLVYLPAGYGPRRRLPVFYMLHGMPGRPLAFTVNADVEVRLERLIKERRIAPMILVFPDGRIDGRTSSDSEWANTPAGDYENYVLDVVSDVDHRFATRACRQERAIAGLSAGAYGAANIGLHQDATFGLVQVWSGYFRETHDGVFAHADRAVMAYNSPIDYVRTMARTFHRYPLRIFIYAGRDESGRTQIPAMAAALRAAGADESSALYAGGHSWKTWTPHVDQMLIMASRDFAHPLGPSDPRCTERGPE